MKILVGFIQIRVAISKIGIEKFSHWSIRCIGNSIWVSYTIEMRSNMPKWSSWSAKKTPKLLRKYSFIESIIRWVRIIKIA